MPLPAHLHAEAVALWHACGLTRPWNDPDDDLRRAVRGPASTVLAALDDDVLVGTAMTGHDGHRAWVYYLAVREDRRGFGVGRLLMTACERWAAEAGMPKLQLMVRGDNGAATAFYERLGYVPSDVLVLGTRLDEPVLRPYARADREAVRDLVLAGLADRWGAPAPELNPDVDDVGAAYGDGTTVTAWVGGRLVATGTLVPRDPGTAEVVRMSTAADARRRGTATRVLRALLDDARARGVRTVVLETAAAWTDARALYERHGFVLDREEDGPHCRDAHYRLEL